MTQQEYDNLVQAVMSKESADRIMRERGLVVNGIPMNAELPAVDPSQAAVGQPQSQGSFAVPVAPPPPSSLSVRGPEDQSAYAKNTATLAALRSDPLGYMSGMRAEQLGLVEKRIADLTDPKNAGYRNRSQANWFNLAAQLMKPTMSGSVVENLGGAFGYLGSEAAKRQDLLAALQEKRAELAQKYDIAMLNAQSDIQEKLIAARAPKYSLTSTGEWKIQPGTGGTPSMNNKGQYIVSTPEEAKNVPAGAPFIFASDAKPVPTVYYGQ